MKTRNSLEEVMRSWTPRAPSERIEKRLFANAGGRAPEASGRAETWTMTRRSTSHRLPWWQTLGASAVAFAVAVMTLFNVAQLTATDSPSSAWLSLSNHSCAATFAMASAPINTWRAPIFGWTNERTVGSNARPFDLLSTNRSLR
jgi:hypothetical protein